MSIVDLRRDSGDENVSPCQLIKIYIGQMRIKLVRTLIYTVIAFLKGN